MATTPPLKPIYLILSEQSFLRNQAVTRLRARVEQEGDLDFNYEQLDATTADVRDVLAAANTLPFASPYRLVLVSHIEELKKDALDALAEYAASPCETTVLALVGTKLNKSTKLYKETVKQGAVLDRKAPSKKELPAVVQGLFKEKALVANFNVAQSLINSLGEDLGSITIGIEKIKSYVGQRTEVTLEDVAAVVGVSVEVKVWEFTTALAERQGVVAMELLSRTLEQGNSIFAAQSLAIRTMRDLICARALIDRGEGTPARIAAELGKQEWLARKTLAQAQRFSAAELRGFLAEMAQVEYKMKTSRDNRLAFECWVLKVCNG